MLADKFSLSADIETRIFPASHNFSKNKRLKKTNHVITSLDIFDSDSEHNTPLVEHVAHALVLF